MIQVLKVEIPETLLILVDNFDGDGLRDFLGAFNYTEEFQSWVRQYITFDKLVKNWINYTKYDIGVDNTFTWHDDIHRKGSTLGILWLDGSIGYGGDLLIMDEDCEMHRITFEPNTLIIMENKFPHKVEHYFGTEPRVALNFTLK